MFTDLILDKLGFFYEDIAKKKHGDSSDISYGELIDTILNDNGNTAAHKLFPIGMQTFNRMMRKMFPNIRLNGGTQTWYFYLLSIIDYKKCSYCNNIRHFNKFHKDKNASSIGISSICKECTSIEVQGQYRKYYDVHQKSYIKNKSKIQARQQLYKGERSLRIPPWYDKQKEEIELFYANCPTGYQVDHILPLKGRNVSGLHVINNLQYLTAKENMKKGNRED